MSRRDLAFVAAALGVAVVIFVPLPSAAVDVLLLGSIAASVAMLWKAVTVREPLAFASFPSLLLLSTAFRLALAVATTRLVLGRASVDGTLAAGRVIRAFGELVAGREPLIGAVLFAILVVINFVVLSKGATRISEVAARFMLDALPGRQAAIDADAESGTIDGAESARRRERLAREADFHGAMDGATKFIRGDAIAGVAITLVNIVGGLAIGVLQHGMALASAAKTYTLLTIGDGLAMQLPSLLVSLAAGMLVTRERRAVVEAPAPKKTAETVESLVRVEALEIELGCGLGALVAGGLPDRIARMRRQMAAELGFVVPSVRVFDSPSLKPAEYVLRLRGASMTRGSARLNAASITQICADLESLVRANAAELLTRDDVTALVKALKETRPSLVDEVVPGLVKPVELQRVLQGLLSETVSIRDLGTILESFDGSRDIAALTERARAALSRSICQRLAVRGVLRVVELDPSAEDAIALGRVDGMVERIARETDRLVVEGRPAVVLCRPGVRPAARKLADAARPGIAVISTAEVPAAMRVETAGVVTCDAIGAVK